jgi:hypothetical protein
MACDTAFQAVLAMSFISTFEIHDSFSMARHPHGLKTRVTTNLTHRSTKGVHRPGGGT